MGNKFFELPGRWITVVLIVSLSVSMISNTASAHDSEERFTKTQTGKVSINDDDLNFTINVPEGLMYVDKNEYIKYYDYMYGSGSFDRSYRAADFYGVLIPADESHYIYVKRVYTITGNLPAGHVKLTDKTDEIFGELEEMLSEAASDNSSKYVWEKDQIRFEMKGMKEGATVLKDKHYIFFPFEISVNGHRLFKMASFYLGNRANIEVICESIGYYPSKIREETADFENLISFGPGSRYEDFDPEQGGDLYGSFISYLHQRPESNSGMSENLSTVMSDKNGSNLWYWIILFAVIAGVWYVLSRSSRKKEEEAMKWREEYVRSTYERAAGGDVEAMHRLADHYEKGEYVEQDCEQARAWREMADQYNQQ